MNITKATGAECIVEAAQAICVQRRQVVSERMLLIRFMQQADFLHIGDQRPLAAGGLHRLDGLVYGRHLLARDIALIPFLSLGLDHGCVRRLQLDHGTHNHIGHGEIANAQISPSFEVRSVHGARQRELWEQRIGIIVHQEVGVSEHLLKQEIVKRLASIEFRDGMSPRFPQAILFPRPFEAIERSLRARLRVAGQIEEKRFLFVQHFIEDPVMKLRSSHRLFCVYYCNCTARSTQKLNLPAFKRSKRYPAPTLA